MSKRSRKQPPAKTAFGTMLRSARRVAPMGDETYRTTVLRELPQSRTIVMDPAQAVAAVGAVSRLSSIRDLATTVRPPFPSTLIDFGSGVEATRGRPVRLLGALFCNVGLHDGNEVLLLLDSADKPELIVYSHDSFFNPEPAEAERELARQRAELQALREADEADEPELARAMEELAKTLERLVETQSEVVDARTSVADLSERIENDDPDFVKLLAAPYAALAVLESANVELVDSVRPYVRGHVAFGTPKFDIYIRQNRRSAGGSGDGFSNYSHRFEVRGNFAHHFELTASGTPNRLFERWSVEKPEKVVQVGGQPCIRIWRPPYVKGPEDKPLIPKIRHLATASERKDRR